MKKLISLLSLLMVLSMLLSACGNVPAASTTDSTTTTENTTLPSDEPDELTGVYINEVAGKNYGGNLAPDGNDYDWIDVAKGSMGSERYDIAFEEKVP